MGRTMKNSIRYITAFALIAGAAGAAGAQNAPPPPMGAPGGGRSAQMFLARSAELDLTDAQIVKLAAIARKSETRQRARRAAMDSARTRFAQPGDSVARRAFGQRMQGDMEKERDLSRVELRDALAILTPDQQAKAWEMNANRGRPGRGPGGGAGRMGDRPRMQRPPREMGDRMPPDGDRPRREMMDRARPDGPRPRRPE
jgi:hypothetical protein